jgi:hypothetical protein
VKQYRPSVRCACSIEIAATKWIVRKKSARCQLIGEIEPPQAGWEPETAASIALWGMGEITFAIAFTLPIRLPPLST